MILALALDGEKEEIRTIAHALAREEYKKNSKKPLMFSDPYKYLKEISILNEAYKEEINKKAKKIETKIKKNIAQAKKIG